MIPAISAAVARHPVLAFFAVFAIFPWLVPYKSLGAQVPYDADEESLVPYGHVPTGLGKIQFYKGKGCPVCNFTGMKGRIAIYEVMPITQGLRDTILKAAPTAELREIAQAQGMKTLRQSGLLKVVEGTTTVDEVLRVTMS